MDKPIEFCPCCGSRKKMDLSLGLIADYSTRRAEDSLLYHYHCASCNTYVRSSTIDFEELILSEEFSALPLPAYVW